MSRITVIFPLYNAASTVPALVGSIASQRHPSGLDPAEWLKVIFIDNASADETIAVLERELAETDVRAPVRVVQNPENLGLARSFNRALGMTETEFVLTCHADCQFGSETYVAAMLDLLDRHPDAAAITGQPAAAENLTRVEKVYLTANLMDLFPSAVDSELVEVGFAEGRCDAFRMDALRTVGLYETALRRAGEDQVMAARLRAAGYRLYQAPRERYYLSVSSDQDSLSKLIRHTRLFGRVYPYILFTTPGTLSGIVTRRAGRNRNRRAMLRALQLTTGGTALAATLTRGNVRSGLVWGLVGLGALRASLFRPYIRHLGMRSGDITALALIQAPMDLAFYLGVSEGIGALADKSPGGDPI